MKKLSLLLAVFLVVGNLKAQDCKIFLPHEKGTKLELTSYNGKGKKDGKSIQELTGIEEKGGGTHYAMNIKSFDAKDKPLGESEATFKCVDNVFYMDMNSFLNEEQMAAYKDMDVQVTMDEIDIPSNYSVGQTLKDGKITVSIKSQSPIDLSFTIEIKNRKIEAEEEVTTPAGTFKCVKISQDVETKSFMAMTMQSVDWYSEGVGVVKNESYRKGEKMGYIELTSIVK